MPKYELLVFIEVHHRRHGIPPSLTEIGNHFYVSYITAKNWCVLLLAEGYLKKINRQNRHYVVNFEKLSAWAWAEEGVGV